MQYVIIKSCLNILLCCMSWYKNTFEILSVKPIIQYKIVPRIAVNLNDSFFFFLLKLISLEVFFKV